MKNSESLQKPPACLSKEACDIWNKITSGWVIDAAGLLILETSLESFDLMRKAQAILAKEGIQVKDRFGQIKQHPSVLTERDAKSAYMKGLKMLNLDLAKETK